MSEFLCIVLAIVLALVYWWARFEIRKLRLRVDALAKETTGFSANVYEAKLQASSASRASSSVLDRVREMYAHKDDVQALADALGMERYYSPEQNGWRKKGKP